MKRLAFKKNAISILTVSLVYILSNFPVAAQEVGPSAMIGTQFPLQYTIGFNYPISPKISARAQIGLLTKPYDRIVLKAMESFGLEKKLSRTIESSLQNGLMATLGANYHFGKNYVGLYGQYAHLKGETNLAEAASAYFGRDLSFLNPFGISLLELSTSSNLYNIGLLYGRRFILPNPRFEILAEAGFGKILGSSNKFTSNQAFIERIPVVQQLYATMDRDFNSAYWKHGFLPSINIYLTYHF
jgi:hypothetical protein